MLWSWNMSISQFGSSTLSGVSHETVWSMFTSEPRHISDQGPRSVFGRVKKQGHIAPANSAGFKDTTRTPLYSLPPLDPGPADTVRAPLSR